jgi:hypothetical protein
MPYESHAYLPAKWRLDGAGADVTLKHMESNLTEGGTELVKKLAGNLGLPERYPGFGDAEFTVKLLVDSSALPSASAGLGFRFGAKGTLRWPVSTTALAPNNWFHVHVMVRKVNYVIANDDLLEYSCDVALDASANAQGQSSPFVYPT